MKRCDVAVIGAGAAGIAAAITTARAGLSTLLIERDPQPGGTVVKGSITTLCGLYVDAGGAPRFIYDGFTSEFVHALMEMDGVSEPLRMGRFYVLLFRPNSFQQLAFRLMAAEKALSSLYSTELIRVATNQKRIEGLVVQSLGWAWEVEAGMVIDCSGNAVVSSLASQAVMPGDAATQTSALMVPVTNTAWSSTTPARRIQILLTLQRAVAAGTLHVQASATSFMPSLEVDTVVLKVNTGAAFTATTLTQAEIANRARLIVSEIMAFLQSNVAEFSHSRVNDDSLFLLHRCSSRPIGKSVLKGSDVLSASACENAVTRGCWPVERWDLQGRQHLGYLPEGTCYDIPAGALQARDLKNLFMAGKTLSADDEAITSARVIGCCLATGEAAGRLAGG